MVLGRFHICNFCSDQTDNPKVQTERDCPLIYNAKILSHKDNLDGPHSSDIDAMRKTLGVVNIFADLFNMLQQ